MTGSGKNATLGNILTGQPLSLLYTGDVILADAANVAFACATLGGATTDIVSWQTDGFITRLDWTAIAGTRFLAPNERYFLSGKGTISRTGTQQIGVAKSKTDLRVDVQSINTATATVVVTPTPTPTPSPVPASSLFGDIDGGEADSVYGGTDPVDGGAA